MLKAIREAKQNTSWINQNTEYEGAITSFVRALLNPAADNEFLQDFVPFQRRIARIGMWNSLSQTILKLTCPGVPDVYQGNELWNFSLVDPDNRQSVDYDHRQKIFEGLNRGNAPETSSIDCLMKTPEDGRIKSYLIWRTLCLRQRHAEVFQQGEYLPLVIAGPKADHVVAFARRFEGTCVVVIVPRLISGLLQPLDVPPIAPQIWEDTHVLLPSGGCSKQYQNVFTGEVADLEKQISISKVLTEFPVALCLLR
jgi:(1->4)-alpha-D-glucan 1-alpha-D-glucosylmutase